MVLTSEPASSVTVTPAVTGSTDVTVSPTSLTFTTGSWNTAQTVTVTAAQDWDAELDEARVAHAVAGGLYGSETASDVEVTVDEDETASTAVALSVSTATVAEGAGATSVTVTGTLDEAPRLSATSVTVSIGAFSDAATEGTDYVTVGDLALTIAAGRKTGTATFTLTPTDDDVDESDEGCR